MDYAFNLNWDDLDEELRERLVTEYITYNYENDDYRNEDGEHEKELDELLEDEKTRKEAIYCISAHFPVYF